MKQKKKQILYSKVIPRQFKNIIPKSQIKITIENERKQFSRKLFTKN